MLPKGYLPTKKLGLYFLNQLSAETHWGSDSLAHLLFTLKEAIESGPTGAKQAVNTLVDGIRLVYQYTEEHKLALKLYMLYLTGRLRPQDEPFILLNAAIERGIAEIEQANKKRSTAKSKRTGKKKTSNRK